MYRFAHVKHFGCGRNFEPLRNCETKGFGFFSKIKNFSKKCSIKKERNTSILLYHTSQQLWQDTPKLMVPQESSTSLWNKTYVCQHVRRGVVNKFVAHG